MLDTGRIRIFSNKNPKISINVMQGHFATNHSHINYYIDMSGVKYNSSSAIEAAKTLSARYTNTPVDTIVCLDGCEIIGAYMAIELSKNDMYLMNSKRSINVITPEFNTNSQMIFRDNVQPMVIDKNVILLIASATTGKTIKRSIDCIEYYGGIVNGVSALFNASTLDEDIEVDSIFTGEDIEGYETYPASECPHCRNNHKIDAIVNSFGYSKI
ncbi:MAG: phosphoribosyltransferase [Oscillospiraceae bacterium]